MRKLTSPDVIKAILAESGFRFSKSLGQNFLIDDNVLDEMIANSHIDKTSNILEIGPGFGTLTQRLCMSAGKVVSVEIDETVIPVLKENTREFDNLKIINSDVLKLDLKKLIEEEFDGGEVKVIANLPYYITTPIIMGLLERELPVSMLVVMIQKEVADRICARPSTKDYGAITIAVNYYSEPEIIVNVPPSSFIPQPKVYSSVIKLNMRQEPLVNVKDTKKFFNVVKASFAQRRKTLPNALYNSGMFEKTKDEILSILKSLDIDEKRRGETLSVSDFARISDAL